MANSDISAALQPNYDFSSELALNRIMNGQVQTKNGRTINTATRDMATRHDATAMACGVLAENVAFNKTVLEGTQNALTEIIDQIKKVRDASLAQDLDIDSFGNSFQGTFTALLNTTVQGVKVFQGTGEQSTIGSTKYSAVLDPVQTLDLGDLNLNSSSSPRFKTFYDGIMGNLTTAAGSRDQVAQICEDAIEELAGYIVRKGAQTHILDNRYEMYNDLATTYHEASDNEAMRMGGSMNILNSVS